MIQKLISQNSTSITKNLVLILAAVSVFISMYFAVNIPMWDDYHIILVFLNHFVLANGFLSKLDVLFSADSNYLFTIFKLFILGDYYLLGEVNFTHLVFTIFSISEFITPYINYFKKIPGHYSTFFLLFCYWLYQTMRYRIGHPIQSMLVQFILVLQL